MQSTSGSNDSAEPKLAAAQRTADGTASRGADRTDDNPLAVQIAEASKNGEFGSPSDAPDATTTTTGPPPATEAPAPAPAAAPAPTPAPTAAPAPKPTTPPTTAKPRAVAPKAAPAPAPAPVNSGSNKICELSPGKWCAVAQCESGDKNVNTGNGYYGYFQFSPQTWKAMGGSGLPSDNSAAKQLEIAQKLQARSGWGQWPVCGARG